MAKPQFSSAPIISYGNATSVSGISRVPPAINDGVGVGGSAIKPPSFAAPRMPVIERLTPRNINATRAIPQTLARGQAIATRAVQRVSIAATGYARALTMRQYR